jgi:hypothetical protein
MVIAQPWLSPKNLTEEEKRKLWNGAEGDPHKQNVSTYYSSEVVAQLLSELNEVASRITEENGARIVHVQNCLTPPAACFYDDFHFTPFGAGIVADIVSKAFLQRCPESLSKSQVHRECGPASGAPTAGCVSLQRDRSTL